jgi:hypothetical protein
MPGSPQDPAFNRHDYHRNSCAIISGTRRTYERKRYTGEFKIAAVKQDAQRAAQPGSQPGSGLTFGHSLCSKPPVFVLLEYVLG